MMASRAKNKRRTAALRKRERACPLSHLPAVNDSHAARGLDLASLHERYQAMGMEPLMVRAKVGPYRPADEGTGAVHLDGLLAAAVEKDHPVPMRFSDEANVIPIPVKCLWVSSDGLPLWAASDLRPAGEMRRQTKYWHKRVVEERLDVVKKLPSNTRTGAGKPYRVPYTTIESGAVAGLAFGNAEEIYRLLNEYIPSIGKRGAEGLGRVRNTGFEVLPLSDSHEEFVEHLLRMRPVPISYLSEQDDGIPVNASLRPMTWTPPYWWLPWMEGCVIRA